MEYLKVAHSFRSYYFHLVWSTKDRKNRITEEIEDRLYAYIGGIIKNHQHSLLIIGGTSNHVHLLIAGNVLDKFSYLIRDVKAKSSIFISQNFPYQKNFAWQEGYGSFSVSHSSVDKVKQYIGNQKKHHEKISFDEEFLQLLGKHQIKYDNRFALG
jgi:REP element-mobilizing transposase RayT